MTSSLNRTREFLRTEAGSAGLLLAATVAALIWANTATASYEELLHHHLRLALGPVVIDESLQHWVNDALMAIFFYVVGLEVRRELTTGELRDRRTATVPVLAALAGMVVPAVIYALLNAGGPGAAGWGIPMATDIAFVLGALALLGDRVGPGVRIFLLTLAVADDIGAILVIAIFYAEGVEITWLLGALATVAVIAGAKRLTGPWHGAVYLVAGVVLWYLTYRSGIHPTIAGVALGLLTDVGSRSAEQKSDNERMEHLLHPVSSFIAVPLFALVNAGVVITSEALSAAVGSAVFLGVVLGLLLGKGVGIAGFTYAAVRRDVGPLPTGMVTRHLPGAATLAGIGFTVSIFVAELAFKDPLLVEQAKLGVIAASFVAAVAGLGLLARARVTSSRP